jgi:Ca2+-binding EF-hand superfamily protein
MKAKMMILGVVGAAMAVTAGAAVMAQGKHDDHKRPIFEEVDADGDARITRDEMQARAAARFAEADGNGDGAIDRDEMLAMTSARAEKRVDRMLRRIDTDGDGKVTEAEMRQMRDKRMGKMFKRMDKDGDGGLSKEEFAQTHRKGHHGKHGHGKHRLGDDG